MTTSATLFRYWHPHPPASAPELVTVDGRDFVRWGRTWGPVGGVEGALDEAPWSFKDFMRVRAAPDVVEFCKPCGPLTKLERVRTDARDEGLAVAPILVHAEAMRETWALHRAVKACHEKGARAPAQRKIDGDRLHSIVRVFLPPDSTVPMVEPRSPELRSLLADDQGLPRFYGAGAGTGWTSDALGLGKDVEVTADELLHRAEQLFTMIMTATLRRNLDASFAPRSGAFGPDLSFEPSCLLACLWLQLYRSAAGGIDWRTCERCNQQFAVSKNHRRGDAVVCGRDACKMRAARERQRDPSNPRWAKKTKAKAKAKAKKRGR